MNHGSEFETRLGAGRVAGLRWCGLLVAVATAAAGIGCGSGGSKPGGGWEAEVRTRRAGIDAAIAANREAFDAFETGSLGDATLEMIPYVVFRVLQELEPSAFGDAALESAGFFARTDNPSGRNGVTWTRPTSASPDGTFELRYMTRTCASCHTGRVRLSDGSMRVLHGNANTEANVHLFIGRLTSVLKERLSPSNDTPEYQAFRKRIVDALAGKPPDWFWGADAKAVSPEAAAKEVATVQANIDAVLTTMRQMNDHRLAGIGVLQAHSYKNVANPPSLTGGAPGLVETSGLGSASLVAVVGPDKADLVLPATPSKADIPAVWQIDPLGYANWDGTVRGFARSMTSSLAVVGNPEKIDLHANALIQDFLGKLPPEPYPFALDLAAVARGKATYEKNCAGCHSTASGRSREAQVFDVGTDPLRADAILPMTVVAMRKVVAIACPPTRPECVFPGGETLVDPSPKRGYVAGSLYGVWAQAPYLHNGSVPTLRQLLVPALRTDAPFLRGSVSYVGKDGGWEWEPSKEAELRERGETAIALHDLREAGFSNMGHGSAAKPLVVDGAGAEVRIAWSDGEADKAVVDDLVAYLLSL